MENNKIQVQPFYKRAAVYAASIDEEKRECEVCFASDADVPMYKFGEGRILESLSLEEGAMDETRLNSGAPLLNSHNSQGGLDAILGKVVEDSVRIEDGKAYCRIRFSKRAAVQDYWEDIKDGIITNISVGYNVMRSMYSGTVDDVKRYVATNWQPFEVSFVSVPADHRATVRENSETTEMIVEGEEKEKEVVQAEQIKDDAPQRDQDILKIKYILNK
jgi:HK97 family phage prohead protease